MGRETKIQWCHHTFNPWRGCEKVSEGCAHCYAESMSWRNPAVLGEWGKDGTRVVAGELKWAEPRTWNRAARKAGERRRVFCASLGDVFEDREDLWAPRRRLAQLISDTPNLDWLLLTKRPQNADDMLFRMWFEDASWPGNIWLGTSVENQARADERIDHLIKSPAAVRFLSIEPLLGPIDLTRLDNGFGETYNALTARVSITRRTSFRASDTHPIDWVIVGGESGPKARPCELDWIRSIVWQCDEAGVPVFVKQLGSVAYDISAESGFLEPVYLKAAKGGDPAEWPEELRIREFPQPLAEPHGSDR